MTREAAMMALAECRERIDVVDRHLLRLLNERAHIVEEIGRIKQAAQMAIYEPKREEQVYKNVTENNSGPLTPESLQRIYERIIDEMRYVQRVRMEARSDGENS